MVSLNSKYWPKYSSTYRSKIRNGCIVGVRAPGPHQVDEDVGEKEEDGHLADSGHQVEAEEEDSGEAERREEADCRHEYDVARHGETNQDLQCDVGITMMTR